LCVNLIETGSASHGHGIRVRFAPLPAVLHFTHDYSPKAR
jgi:hypothetical protein